MLYKSARECLQSLPSYGEQSCPLDCKHPDLLHVKYNTDTCEMWVIGKTALGLLFFATEKTRCDFWTWASWVPFFCRSLASRSNYTHSVGCGGPLGWRTGPQHPILTHNHRHFDKSAKVDSCFKLWGKLWTFKGNVLCSKETYSGRLSFNIQVGLLCFWV